MEISKEETLTRQDVLEIESTEERREIALSKFEQISAVIRISEQEVENMYATSECTSDSILLIACELVF